MKRWLIVTGVLVLSLALTGAVLAAAVNSTIEEPAAAVQAHPFAEVPVEAPAVQHASQARPVPPPPSMLEEHFDAPTFPPPGWTVVNHGGNCVWTNEAGEPTPEGNLTAGMGGFADADSNACGSGTTMDTSLVSPPFDLSTASPGIALEFVSDFHAMGSQIASVEISNSLVLTWTSVWSTSGNTVNELVHIDLSAYIGYANNRVRFHFKSPGWNSWWQVDDVLIAQPRDDLFMFHQAPAYSVRGTPVPFTLTLMNNGPTNTMPLTFYMPILPGEEYLTGTLTCTGGMGFTCTYDSLTQRILWNGILTPAGSVDLQFFLSPTISTSCDFIPALPTVEDPYGMYMQEFFGVDFRENVYQYYDFESSGAGFTPSGAWTWGPPDPISAPRGPGYAYNGQGLWGTNLYGAYSYGPHILTRTLDLSSIPPSPVGIELVWKHWLDLAPGDFFNVYINNDQLLNMDSRAPQRNWDYGGIDLTPYLGQVVTLTFELQPNNGVPPYTGVYIDSLAVVEACPYAFAGWDQYQAVCPGEVATYTLFAKNSTYQTQTLNLNVSGNNWLTTLSNNNFALYPGGFSPVTATVQTPVTAPVGSVDQARILATFSPDPFTNTFTLTTETGPHWVNEMFAPVPAADGAAVSFNDETYYFPGGITETAKYTPALGSWLPLAPQPVPAYASGDACLGTDSSGVPVIVLFPDAFAGTSWLHVYNIALDAWSSVPPAGSYTPRNGISIVSDIGNNLCYISGGQDISGTITATLQAYNPASNTIVSLGNMNTPRAYHTSWIDSRGYVCVAGGADPTGFPLDSTQCYNPTAGTWETENASFGHIPHPQWGMARVQTGGDEVWLLGGSPDIFVPESIASATQDTYFWDTTALTWTWGVPLPYPVYGASADIQAGEIYLVGGIESWMHSGGPVGNPTDAHQRLNTCQAAPVAADLWLQKYANPPVVAVNTPFTYTLEVGNNGPSWATNVVVEDYLPPGVTVTLPSVPLCVAQAGVFTCTLGSIPPGGVAYVDVQATSIISGVQLNQAVAYGNEPDPDPGNNIAAAQSYFTQQTVNAPLIFDVTPSQGVNISPTVITITGMNFNPGLTVTLGSQSLTHIRRNSGLISAIVPAGLPPDSYDVSVTNPDGQSDTAVQAFTVYADSSPKIYAIFPEESTNDVPAGIIILGENFAPGAVAILSGTMPVKASVPFTVALGGNYFVNGNVLISVVPKGLPAQTYTLIVVNPNGKYAVLPQAYTVIDAASLDLYGRHGDLWTDPHTVRSGDTITVGATVRRTGGLSTTLANVDVAFYIGDPSSGVPITIGFGSAGPIPPRDTGVATTTLDLTGVPPGFYDLYAVLDPADQVPELDESNNILTYTLAVLPGSSDTQPPTITSFKINNGAQRTNQVQVSLALSATDNIAPAYMFYMEFTYQPALGFWWPVQSSGWQPYQATSPTALYATPGVHYILAWVADAAGNVSTHEVAWINLMQPSTPIASTEIHPYRLRLHTGDSVRVRLTSGTGDADLYVFAPDDSFVGSSENSTPVDEVAFTAAQDGVYQIEVEGYAASSTYTLEVLPGSATTRMDRLPPEDRTPAKPARPLRGRASPILSVGEEPSANTGLENVPNTLYTINLPLIMR